MPIQLPNGQMYQAGQQPEPAPEQPSAEEVPDGSPVPEPSGPIECVTAFIVVQLPEGQWQVVDDLDAPLVPARKPHLDDFTAGCATVARDAEIRETLNTFVQHVAPSLVENTVKNTLDNFPRAMMAFTQAMQEQAGAGKLMQQLNAEKHARGGR